MNNFAAHFITIFFVSDPCKKCIIKSCCSDKCEERIVLENFTGYSDLWYMKFCAGAVWFAIIVMIFNVKNYWILDFKNEKD